MGRKWMSRKPIPREGREQGKAGRVIEHVHPTAESGDFHDELCYHRKDGDACDRIANTCKQCRAREATIARLESGQCHHGWRGHAPDRGERIVDPCPSCGQKSLFIGSGGYLTCASLAPGVCKMPGVGRAVEVLQERVRTAEAAAARADRLADAVRAYHFAADPEDSAALYSRVREALAAYYSTAPAPPCPDCKRARDAEALEWRKAWRRKYAPDEPDDGPDAPFSDAMTPALFTEACCTWLVSEAETRTREERDALWRRGYGLRR
jgi:hypothetical protein